MSSGAATPAFAVSTADSGKPVGPGSQVDYTVTVRNFGSGPATGVTVRAPLPARSTLVTAGQGGTPVSNQLQWRNLSLAAGASLTLTFSVQLSVTPPTGTTTVTLNGPRVTSAQGPGTLGSPHVTPFAAPFAVSLRPSQTGAAHPGDVATYPLRLSNTGYQPSAFRLTAGGPWATRLLDARCVTPVATTVTVAPGASLGLCARVTVPTTATDGATQATAVTATSTSSAAATAKVVLRTIAVTDDVLVVDGDGNAPDVQGLYTGALDADAVAYDVWDLKTDPTLPLSVLTTHTKVVWFTGNSYPAPIGAYESELATYLDGGGRLFLSGQDVLDQAAGTTAFVRDYLHVDWDGTEAQNDKETPTVTGVAADPVTGGFGTVPLDHTVLGATYEDQVTPIDPAAAAFTDASGATDALTVSTDGYAVVFLAFPFEAFGTAAQKARLLQNVLTFFG